ncbi:phosphoribosylglycinamide formyltransferase [Paenibacillus selenitireducens]|uniref:Phosphoribosylglycinamide formyltransferase n=1 Tax=Paenibacillus selenitireducens TaxID=1324314 RepID=A0A1T2X0U6_9BACL|nr:phosphoribosylglycinamide formyltransferase [Paenibacillus selenitireducens]OPA73425.1 phosphoribosylglycinamide formyltransferase [Paenibacillus selenitireducens]
MQQPLRIAVFASGNGSNFQALADAVQAGELDATIELLVCDKPKAKVVERAKLAGVEPFIFEPKRYASREVYEAEILQRLTEKKVDLIVLAGYMRIITDTLVTPYYGRMINIHPSLLPAFPGVNAIRQAMELGVKLTGVTVHFVDGGMDTGPIIAQRAVEIEEEATEASVTESIHAVEMKLYPQVVQWIAKGQVQLVERKVQIIHS